MKRKHGRTSSTQNSETRGGTTRTVRGYALSSPSPKGRSLAVVSAAPLVGRLRVAIPQPQRGVIEAKKRDLPYTEGVAQAKDYAERMQIRFAYATNGLKIYRIDMKLGQEEEVDRFPTPEELYDATFAEANEWRDKLFSVPFEDKGGAWQPRYYQENAISRVLEAVANDEDRILLTLATGTGKTAISFQIAWKLFHAKWSLQRDGTRRPRILFLADRNVLADQAFNSFGAFDEDALVRIRPSKSKSGERSKRTGASSLPSSKRS